MGMFDYVTCEYPLPIVVPFLSTMDFQTKDLNNLLDNYTISKDGQLFLLKEEYESVPEEQRPFYGTDKWHGFWKSAGSMKAVSSGLEEVDYTGKINFYNWGPEAIYLFFDNSDIISYDFVGTFENGWLVELKGKTRK